MSNSGLFQIEQVNLSDYNFRFEENGGKFSKRVENTAGKEENAYYEQFLLFPSVFSRHTGTAGM